MSYYTGGAARYQAIYNETLQPCRDNYVNFRNIEDVNQYTANPDKAPRYLNKAPARKGDMIEMLNINGIPTPRDISYNELIKLMRRSSHIAEIGRYNYMHKMGYKKRGEPEPVPVGLAPPVTFTRPPAPVGLAPPVILQRPLLTRDLRGQLMREPLVTRENFAREYVARNPGTDRLVVDAEGIKYPQSTYEGMRGFDSPYKRERRVLGELGYEGRGKLNRGVNPYKKLKRGRPL